MPDISAIMTFHNEGCIAIPSIRSAMLCREYCNRYGTSVELIAVLDRANDETAEVIEEMAEVANMRITRTDIGDCGGARNEGVKIADGTYCSFLDGDDLWGHKWLQLAFAYAKSRDRPSILHPSINVYFGRQEHIYVHVDMDDPDFSFRVMAMQNYWTALTFAATDILLAHPIEVHRHDDGFAYEDWHWHMETLSKGIRHATVPDTVHFIRQRLSGSILLEANAKRLITKPSPSFRKLLFEEANTV